MLFCSTSNASQKFREIQREKGIMTCNKRVIVSIMVLIMLVLAEAQVDRDIGYRSTKRCAKECGLTCLPLLLPKLVAGCLGVCMLKCKFIPWQVVYNCTSACTKTKVDSLSLTSGVQGS